MIRSWHTACIAACVVAAALGAGEADAEMRFGWLDILSHKAIGVDIGGKPYVATASQYPDNYTTVPRSTNVTERQQQAAENQRGSIHLIDMSDPEYPRYASGAFGLRDGFHVPKYVTGMAAAEIGGRTYLAAAGSGSVLLLDVSDPENLVQVARIHSGLAGFEGIGPIDTVSMHRVSNATLAFVGSNIIDVTDPSSPVLISNTLGSTVNSIAELSGRTYVLTGGGVLDMTDPLDPVPVRFDDMVTLEMWFETDYPVEFVPTASTERMQDGAVRIEHIMVPDAGSLTSAPMSDFTPDALLEIGDGLYALAHLRQDGIFWHGLIDVTDPERPVAVPWDFPAGPKAVIARIGETFYAFPHPDFEWPGYSDWVFRLDREGTSFFSWVGYSDRLFGLEFGKTVPAARVSYDPPDYWSAFTNTTDGDIVSIETPYYGVEIEGRTYVLVDGFHPYDGQHVIRDITDVMRDGPYVFRTDLAPGDTWLLIEDHHNGTERYQVVPDIRPGDWWEPAPASVDGEHPRIAGYSDGFWPGGQRVERIMEIEGRTYGLKDFWGLGDRIIDITDPVVVSAVTPVMMSSHPSYRTLGGVGDTDIFEISGQMYALAGPSKHVVEAYRLINSWPALSGHALPHSAPVSHGSELLPHQATWAAVAATYIEILNSDRYTEISHGDSWQPTVMPVPEDAVVTEHGGRTYGLAVIGEENGVQRPGGVYAFDITDPGAITASLVPGNEAFGITELGGKPHTMAHSHGLGISTHRSGVTTYDVSDPRNPAKVSTKAIAGGFFGLAGTRDLAVAEIGGRTYAVAAGEEKGGAIQVVDITDPAELKPVSAVFAEPEDGASDLNQDVAIAEMGGRTYAVAAPWGSYALMVIDISDPQRPVQLGGVLGGQGGFMPLDDVRDVGVAHFPGGAYALVASRGDGAVQVVDISNPANPRPAGSIGAVGPHTVKIDEVGDKTYATILGRDRHTSIVKVMDVTDPRSINTKANIPEGPYLKHAASAAVTEIGGRTYALVGSVGDNKAYLQITDITDTTVAVAGLVGGRGGFEPPNAGYDIGVVEAGGKTWMVVAGGTGSQMVDISDPAWPAIGADVPVGYNPLTVEIGSRTYVASTGGVILTDVTDPQNPVFVAGAFDSNTYRCSWTGPVEIHTWAPGTRC